MANISPRNYYTNHESSPFGASLPISHQQASLRFNQNTFQNLNHSYNNQSFNRQLHEEPLNNNVYEEY